MDIYIYLIILYKILFLMPGILVAKNGLGERDRGTGKK
jgi:hypothetical protein